jgi:hypothetical protein
MYPAKKEDERQSDYEASSGSRIETLDKKVLKLEREHIELRSGLLGSPSFPGGRLKQFEDRMEQLQKSIDDMPKQMEKLIFQAVQGGKSGLVDIALRALQTIALFVAGYVILFRIFGIK